MSDLGNKEVIARFKWLVRLGCACAEERLSTVFNTKKIPQLRLREKSKLTHQCRVCIFANNPIIFQTS